MPPVPEIISHISTNPYFGAGVGLIGVGSGVAILRSTMKASSSYIRRNFFVSVEIVSKDKSFTWVLDWMSSRGYFMQHNSVETQYIQYENGDISTKMQLVPATGTHYFFYRGRVIQVDRTREKNVVDLTSGNLWETLTLTTWGRDRNLFLDILNEARSMAVQKEEGSTVIYTTSGLEWRRFGFPRKKRPLPSVVLAEGKAEKIADDAREFLSRMKWYADRGIPYRRGYLLYGPPGSGKSSYIFALAGELKLNVCVLNLHNRGLTDDMLNHLLNIAPQRSIILLEDIDAALEKDSKSPNSLTFSGLLNALDGVAATEGGGRLIFMTSNHPEKLPSVLIRPGRVDVKVLIDWATPSQIERMFLKFFPQQYEMAVEFRKKVCSGQLEPVLKDSSAQPVPLSMAQLQGFMLLYKDNPTLALENADNLFALDKALSTEQHKEL